MLKCTSVGAKDIKAVLCFYRGIFYAVKTEKVDRIYYPSRNPLYLFTEAVEESLLQRKFVVDAGISDGFHPLQKHPLFVY